MADPDAGQRLAAVEAAVRVGSPIIPLLVAALAYTPPGEADARRAVVIALGRLGPAARPALPLLRSLADDFWLGPCVRPAIARIERRRRTVGTLLLLAAVAAAGVGLATVIPAGGPDPVAAGLAVVAASVAAGVWWVRPGPTVLAWGFVVAVAAVAAAWAAGGLTGVFGRVSRALAGP